MLSYLSLRLIKTVPVLFGVSLAVFLMLHALPVDPVRMLAMDSMTGTAPTTGVSKDTYESLRHQLGLDKPLAEQFALFAWKAVHGNLGKSFRNNRPVADMLFEQFPSTVQLTFAGLALAVILGAGAARDLSRSGLALVCHVCAVEVGIADSAGNSSALTGEIRARSLRGRPPSRAISTRGQTVAGRQG